MKTNRLFEQILKDAASYYHFVHEELHGLKGIEVISQEIEPRGCSCLDYSGTGDDSDPDDHCKGFFRWNDCELTMRGDGLYFESKSGKKGAITIYSICKVEAKPNEIRLWIAPKDTSDDFAVVRFTSYATE